MKLQLEKVAAEWPILHPRLSAIKGFLSDTIHSKYLFQMKTNAHPAEDFVSICGISSHYF